MISENKLKHLIGVARECRRLAKEKGLTTDMCNAMFIMGLLHDIGYEDVEDSTHGDVGYDLVKDFGMHLDDCCDAILTHGISFDNWSVFDEILNTADITVSYDGNNVSIEDRLDGIKEKWGSDSVHYQHAVEVVNKLKEFNSK